MPHKLSEFPKETPKLPCDWTASTEPLKKLRGTLENRKLAFLEHYIPKSREFSAPIEATEPVKQLCGKNHKLTILPQTKPHRLSAVLKASGISKMSTRQIMECIALIEDISVPKIVYDIYKPLPPIANQSNISPKKPLSKTNTLRELTRQSKISIEQIDLHIQAIQEAKESFQAQLTADYDASKSEADESKGKSRRLSFTTLLPSDVIVLKARRIFDLQDTHLTVPRRLTTRPIQTLKIAVLCVMRLCYKIREWGLKVGDKYAAQQMISNCVAETISSLNVTKPETDRKIYCIKRSGHF
jgi:hypothetical protein